MLSLAGISPSSMAAFTPSWAQDATFVLNDVSHQRRFYGRVYEGRDEKIMHLVLVESHPDKGLGLAPGPKNLLVNQWAAPISQEIVESPDGPLQLGMSGFRLGTRNAPPLGTSAFAGELARLTNGTASQPVAASAEIHVRRDPSEPWEKVIIDPEASQEGTLEDRIEAARIESGYSPVRLETRAATQ
jgi:hypothetical protein